MAYKWLSLMELLKSDNNKSEASGGLTTDVLY
jgi:hypothetical protein